MGNERGRDTNPPMREVQQRQNCSNSFLFLICRAPCLYKLRPKFPLSSPIQRSFVGTPQASDKFARDQWVLNDAASPASEAS